MLFIVILVLNASAILACYENGLVSEMSFSGIYC